MGILGGAIDILAVGLLVLGVVVALWWAFTPALQRHASKRNRRGITAALLLAAALFLLYEFGTLSSGDDPVEAEQDSTSLDSDQNHR